MKKYLNTDYVIKMILFLLLSTISIIILTLLNEKPVIQKTLAILFIFFIIIFYIGKICEILKNILNMILQIKFWESQLLIISIIIGIFSIFYFFPNFINFDLHNIGILLICLTGLIIFYPMIRQIFNKDFSPISFVKKIIGICAFIGTIYLLNKIMNNQNMSTLYIFLAGLGLAGIVIYISDKFKLIKELGPFAFGLYSIFATWWLTYFIPDFTTFAFSSFLSRSLLKYMNNICTLILLNLCIVSNFLYYVQDPFTILKVFIIMISIGILIVGMAIYWAPILCTDIDFIEEETGWSYTKIIGILLFTFSLFLVRNIYKTVQFADTTSYDKTLIWSSPLGGSDILYAILIYGCLFITTELTWEKIDLKKNLAESFWLRTGYSLLILFVGSMLDYKIYFTSKGKPTLQILLERGIVWLIVITFFIYSIFKMGYLETVAETVDETEKDILSTLKNPNI